MVREMGFVMGSANAKRDDARVCCEGTGKAFASGWKSPVGAADEGAGAAGAAPAAGGAVAAMVV